MPKYNVHLYREMKIKFKDVEAPSAEEAAGMVRDWYPELSSSYEYEVDDCDGQNFGCVVDEIDSGGEFEHETQINFDEGALRDSAPQLLEALELLLEAVEMDIALFPDQPHKDSRIGKARDAIAKAKMFQMEA